ncbi:hypothetical protein B4900_10295 [Yersinia rohdei]|nr:hypothetical protein B4900_10295 [Yersinia rohdei]
MNLPTEYSVFEFGSVENMNNSKLVIRVLNIILKIIFYTFFNAILFAWYLFDGKFPDFGSKLYISFGCAIICTFVPTLDYMREVIDSYFKIRSK